MKRWNYSYYSNRIEFQLLSETGPFAQNKTIRRPFFHHKYYKKGENKIAVTRLMEQKFGSAEVGLQCYIRLRFFRLSFYNCTTCVPSTHFH